MRVLAKLLAPLRRCWRPGAIVLLCAVAGLVQAQSVANDGSADPPSRVARLSYLSGDLGFLPAGAKDWSDANINRPLTTGDRLSTGQNARAELELGGGTLRMAGQTDFGLLDLNDELAQVELTEGTLNLTVRQLEQGQSYEIDTPTVALVVNQPGSFRVDIAADGRSTQVTAFDGRAIVYGENNAQRDINAGRSYRFVDSSLAAVAISDIRGGDAFDGWNNERNRRYASSDSRRYVSEDVVGYQDLDQYGGWQTTSDYGAVWFPANVDADWAPYRDGHWTYIAPWGWSWVDDSPWGFAPYHYGRWAYVRGGWGWIPGPISVRPIYAPALVAFVGGGGWSVGIGGSPVGWFPLGPGEIYNPWYRSSRNYYTNVNVTNIRVTNRYNHTTIINNINNHYGHYRDNQATPGQRYVNRDAPRGFTAVPGKAFASGQRVQRDLLHVDPRQLATASVLPRGASLRPAAAGSTAPPRSSHARSLPTGGFDREVVARRAPPAARSTRSESAAGRPRGVPSTPSNVRLLTSRAPGVAAGGAASVGPGRNAADRPGLDRNGVGRNGPERTAVGRGVESAPVTLPAASELGQTAGARRDRSGAPVLIGQPQGNGKLPVVPPIRSASEPRTGELPSARYARPQRDAGMREHGNVEPREPVPARAAPEQSMQQAPRPGVSYISHAAEPLPQVPRFERVAPNQSPASERRAQPAEAPRMVRPNEPPADQLRGRNPSPPRFERAASQDSRPVREMTTPRQSYEPPRRESAPVMQHPHATPPAQREEAKPTAPASKRPSRPERDDQQH